MLMDCKHITYDSIAFPSNQYQDFPFLFFTDVPAAFLFERSEQFCFHLSGPVKVTDAAVIR